VIAGVVFAEWMVTVELPLGDIRLNTPVESQKLSQRVTRQTPDLSTNFTPRSRPSEYLRNAFHTSP